MLQGAPGRSGRLVQTPQPEAPTAGGLSGLPKYAAAASQVPLAPVPLDSRAASSLQSSSEVAGAREVGSCWGRT